VSNYFIECNRYPFGLAHYGGRPTKETFEGYEFLIVGRHALCLALARLGAGAGVTAISLCLRVGQSAVTANGTGWQATNGGEVQSYGNNGVMGNTTDGALTSTIALQ
jgi:hypothetical protein